VIEPMIESLRSTDELVGKPFLYSELERLQGLELEEAVRSYVLLDAFNSLVSLSVYISSKSFLRESS
jgi:hypothetical protein